MGLFDRFGKKKEEKWEDMRYFDNPTDIFFESFILDTIGYLSEEKAEIIKQMDLAAIFKTVPRDWKEIVKEVLGLSDTIEIAILDLWYRNRDILKGQGIDYEPVQFAKDFVDNYYKDDSRIDVWKGIASIGQKKGISGILTNRFFQSLAVGSFL
jgi:hypothetical protein